MDTYISFSDYVHIHMYSELVLFLRSILCATATCIATPCLDIDTPRRVVFSLVFLKSAGYLVLQIKNLHQQTILIANIFSYRLATN